MTRHPDQAFLFFASDWLTDERVMLMSPAAKGVYVDLLCHAWIEGSIPADPTHAARIARMDADAFAELWAEIRPCFAAHADRTDRLVQPRQEKERSHADDRRKSRADSAKKAAEARWGKRKEPSERSAERNAPRMRHALPDVVRGDAKAKQSVQSPLPPSGEGAGAARGRGLAALGESAAAPPPETTGREGHGPASTGHAGGGVEATPPPSPDPVVALQDALLATDYRAKVPGLRRKFVVGHLAEGLAETGLTAAHVPRLVQLAARGDEPGALLAHWLDQGIWREVLDERAAKAKQRRARSQAPSRDADPYADTDAPKAAASVIDQALQRVRTA